MKERSKLLREGGENGIVASSRIERNCDLKLASNNSTTVRCHIWFVPTRGAKYSLVPCWDAV
jgi:hypothetical protein